MNKLEDYYTFIDSLQAKGEISPAQMDLYKKVEEDIILEEKTMQVAQAVQPVLSGLRRKVTLVIDYEPTGEIVVKTTHAECHTTSFVHTAEELEPIIDEQPTAEEADGGEDSVDEETVVDVDPVEPNPDDEETTSAKVITRGKRKEFQVFLNGKQVPGKDGSHIVAETIRRIGFKRVASLNIMHSGYNLVSKKQRTDGAVKWQQQLGKWFIYTNTQNPTKVQDLRDIAKRLNIDLKVIEGENNESATSTDVAIPVPPSNAILLDKSNKDEAQSRDLRITFPDGTVYDGKNSKDTFINALKKIGLHRIPEVGIMCAGYNLVDTRQRTDGNRVWQEQVEGKWIYIYFSNPTKVDYLLRIAEFHKLNLTIEAV